MSKAKEFLKRMRAIGKANKQGDVMESHRAGDDALVQFIKDLAADHPERKEVLKAIRVYERMMHWYG